MSRSVLTGIGSALAACWLVIMVGPARAAPVSDAGAAELWFDASRPATLFQTSSGTTAVTTSGNPVGFWGNSSSLTGTSRNATQGNTDRRPTWQTNVINGKAVVRFDGTSDFLDSGAISELDTADLTWFTVSIVSSGSSPNVLRSRYSSPGIPNAALLWGTFFDNGGANNHYIPHARSSSGSLRGVNVGGTTGTPTLVTGVWNGGTDAVDGWGNPGTSGRSTGADATPSGHELTRLGASTGGVLANFLNGDIAEVMVFTSVFNAAQRTATENYLGAKYAINLANNAVANGNYQSLAAAYRNDVIGIGKAADASTSLSAGLSGLRLAAPALTTDDGWVFAGNGDAYDSTTSIQTANTLVQTNLPAGVTDRWSRVWNVETINTIAAGDSLGLTFDWNAGGLGGSFDGTDTFALLYSSAASPATFTTLAASQSSLDAVTKTVTFDLTGAALADGYYTIAIVPEPGTAALLASSLGGLAIGLLKRRRWARGLSCLR